MSAEQWFSSYYSVSARQIEPGSSAGFRAHGLSRISNPIHTSWCGEEHGSLGAWAASWMPCRFLWPGKTGSSMKYEVITEYASELPHSLPHRLAVKEKHAHHVVCGKVRVTLKRTKQDLLGSVPSGHLDSIDDGPWKRKLFPSPASFRASAGDQGWLQDMPTDPINKLPSDTYGAWRGWSHSFPTPSRA